MSGSRSLPFGREELALPSCFEIVGDLGSDAKSEPPPLPDPIATLRGALARPLGQPSLDRFVEPGDRVCVVFEGAGFVGEAAEELVRRCERAGAADISLLAAEEMLERAEPSVTPLGWLAAEGGSFVPRVDSRIARADKVLLCASTSLHPLAGARGGAWLLHGLADEATRLRLGAVLDERCPSSDLRLARAGRGAGDGNPLQTALTEMAALLPQTFVVEVAFQRGGRPAAVFAGELELVQRRALDFLLRWSGAGMGETSALVVASAGGHPFDRSLESAFPALDAALSAVAPGGTLIIAAACPEGLGGDPFAAALRGGNPAGSASSLAGSTLRKEAQRRRLVVVSSGLDETALRGTGISFAPDLEDAARHIARDEKAIRTTLLGNAHRLALRT